MVNIGYDADNNSVKYDASLGKIFTGHSPNCPCCCYLSQDAFCEANGCEGLGNMPFFLRLTFSDITACPCRNIGGDGFEFFNFLDGAYIIQQTGIECIWRSTSTVQISRYEQHDGSGCTGEHIGTFDRFAILRFHRLTSFNWRVREEDGPVFDSFLVALTVIDVPTCIAHGETGLNDITSCVSSIECKDGQVLVEGFVCS